nr:MAG: hypothetical protein 3 [Beijing sediment hepe-like virus 1]
MPQRRRNYSRTLNWGTHELTVPVTTFTVEGEGENAVNYYTKTITSAELFRLAPTAHQRSPASAVIIATAIHAIFGNINNTQGTIGCILTDDTADSADTTNITNSSGVRTHLLSTMQTAGGRSKSALREVNSPNGYLCSASSKKFDGKAYGTIIRRGVSFTNDTRSATGATSTALRFYAYTPASLTSCIFNIQILVKYGGVNVQADAASTVAYDVPYDPRVLSTDFIRTAFDMLSFNHLYDNGSGRLASSRVLGVLFFSGDDVVESFQLITRPEDLLIRLGNSFVFPRPGPSGRYLSLPNRFLRTKNVSEDGNVWFSHHTEVTTTLPIELKDLYERVTTLTPDNRTASEILTSCVNGDSHLLVSGATYTPAIKHTLDACRALAHFSEIAQRGLSPVEIIGLLCGSSAASLDTINAAYNSGKLSGDILAAVREVQGVLNGALINLDPDVNNLLLRACAISSNNHQAPDYAL